MHPRVAQQRERVGFALQVDTLNDDPAPTERVPAAGVDRQAGCRSGPSQPGTAILGLGIGWDAAALGWGTNEFERMGLPYPRTRERQEALGEAVTIIRGVWGPEPFSFRGRHYTATDAQAVPPPLPGAPRL